MQSIRDRLQADIFSGSADPSAYMNECQPNGKFSTVKYGLDDASLGFGPTNALNRIRIMVQAYMSPGNSYYQNPVLKEKIDAALTDWAVNDYQSVTNRWYNTIDTPQKLANILIYGLPYHESYTNKLYEICRRGLPLTVGVRPGSDTGANLTDKIMTYLLIGVSTDDYDMIQQYVTNLLEFELHTYKPPQEGIMADYSFQQHREMLYSAAYGEQFTSDVADLFKYLKGTEFMVSQRAVNLFVNFILDGQRYMFRGDTFDFGVAGRSISRSWGISPRFKAVIAKSVDVLLSIPQSTRRTELLNLKATTLAGNYEGITAAKHFWVSDFTVAHRPEWYVSVRGNSTRTKKPEYGNGENLKGYFLADGTTVIMRDGTEYDDIFPVWDWTKIPGTTAVQVASIPLAGYYIEGGDPFVGGVTDGNNAVSAMVLKNIRATVELDAKKAYFVFSDGFTALGSGITTALNADVVTAINQTLLGGTVVYKDNAIRTLGANSVAFPSGGNIHWALHRGVGYIVNEPKQAVTVSNRIQSGTWRDIKVSESNTVISKGVFGMYINHGRAPTNAKYSYTVLPGVTAQQIESYNGMTEVSNNADCAAVWSETDQSLGIVFWNASGVSSNGLTVTADKPCVLLIKKTEDAVEIFTADPTQTLEAINLTVNGNPISVSLPIGNFAGKTARNVLSIY